jgi:phage major head subunit gpT-like protein
MPAGNIYTPGTLDSRDVIADFYPRLQTAMEKIWAPEISIEIASDRETENFAWLGQVPVMRKWVGPRVEEQLAKYSMTIRNYPYEATLPMSITDLRRDKTGQLRTRVGDLAVRTATHWNSLAGTLITNGGGSTSGLAYDGQYFYDVDHNESGTNQKNLCGTGEVPASDVATTSTLTTTEAANIITQAMAYGMSLTDDKGEPINQGITDLLILCTKVGHYNGLRTALGLTNLGTGSGNNNPLLAWDFKARVEYVQTSRITSADKLYFFFGTPEMGNTPLIRLNEFGVQTSLQGAGSHDEFYQDRHVFGVNATRGIGYGMWQRSLEIDLT